MRVLVVEDDPAIADNLLALLRSAGHAADTCASENAAWAALRAEPFDAMLLDLGLAQGDGHSLLRRLRAAPAEALPDPTMPVLIASARDAIEERIDGLDEGADDYLVKPFDGGELLARLRAAQRRRAGRASTRQRHGELEIDPAGRQVWRNGEEIMLGAREFALLQTFLDAPGQVLSRERLAAAMYGFDEGVESNALEVHIHHLRKKLGDGLIKTMRGVGYFLPKA